MADHEAGVVDSPLEIKDFLADDYSHEGIQLAGRFIVKDQLRLDDQSARDGDALFHAPGKLAGRAVFDSFQAQEVQFLGGNALDLFRFFEAMFAQVEAHVLADGQRIEQGAGLKNHGQAIFVQHPGTVNGFSFDENVPCVGFFQADDVFKQDAFAAAAGTHDDKNLLPLDSKIDALQDQLAIITFAQSTDLDAHTSVRGRRRRIRGVAHFSKNMRKRVTK